MKKLLLCSAFALVSALPAAAQVVLQAYPSNHYWETSVGTAPDPLGNIYVGGQYSFTTTHPFPDANLDVIRKLDPAGNILWRAKMTTAGSYYVQSIASDPVGNVYVFGINHDTVQFQGGQVHTGGGKVLAKYNPAGVLQWSTEITGPVGYNETYLACDAGGNVIISDYANQASNQSPVTYSFGNNLSITTAGSYVAKYSATGTPLWAMRVHAVLTGMAVSAAGEIALGGNLTGPLVIGPNSYSGAPQAGVFTAKLSATGNVLWQNRLPATKQVKDVAIDAAGAVFAAGVYTGTATNFNGTVLPVPPNSGGPNGFLLKFNAAGTQEWANAIENADYNFHINDIIADGNGNCLVTGNFEGAITVQGTSFTSIGGVGYGRDVFLFRFSPAGNFDWGLTGGDTQGYYSDELGTHIALDAQDNIYLTGELTYTFGPYYRNMSFGNIQRTDAGFFVYKISNGQVNKVSGRIFFDYNSNGVKDGTDTYASGIITQSQPTGLYAGTSINGRYHNYVDVGTFSISVPNPPLYYTAAPASHTVNFTTIGNADTTRHFALQPMPGMQDLQVTLATPGFPRPGFEYILNATYKNVGTVALSGSLEVTLDPTLILGTTTPAVTSQTGNTLSWAFANLQPNQSATVSVHTTVPATTPLGGVVTTAAQILPLANDLTPANNTDSITALVVGSYDPNDKQVSQNWLTPSEVSEGKYLEYTIRFQNTGTDTAFTVRLIDTLDAQLNIPTFEMLSSSHPNTWNIRGNGILEWRFDNILLPDSNTNEAASHGFVKYRIRPATNLALGSIIRNTAAIYFDFNEPVITNTATTEVALVSAVADVHKTQLQVYPNPNKGAFTVQLQNVREQSVNAELRNVLGQVVWQQNLAAENGNVQQQIKTSYLSKGVYLLQISTGKGNAVQKVVIE